jgi:nucleoside-diphosphate-sugar epimerase
MKSNSVLIVGCGDLGGRLGLLLLERGWRVTGVRRDISKLPSGIVGHEADYTQTGALDFAEGEQPDFVVTTFNPAERSVDGYRTGFLQATEVLLAGLGAHRPRHIVAVSSTRVFAEQHGGWVDEDSALSVDDPRARAMIEAEQLVLGSSHRASIVRFAGIYGAVGGRLLARIARGELSPAQPMRYSNRIHREDCAGFLAHLLVLADADEGLAPVYIGVDDQPAPQYEVDAWLAAQLDVREPSGAEAAPARGAGGHKRCRNRLLRDSGYPLLYPDYRSGYRAVMESSR